MYALTQIHVQIHSQLVFDISGFSWNSSKSDLGPQGEGSGDTSKVDWKKKNNKNLSTEVEASWPLIAWGSLNGAAVICLWRPTILMSVQAKQTELSAFVERKKNNFEHQNVKKMQSCYTCVITLFHICYCLVTHYIIRSVAMSELSLTSSCLISCVLYI